MLSNKIKVFLTGIAVLFLTGTAHAYPPRYYDCGKAFVKIQMFHGSAPHRRVFPMMWTISENWEKEDRENLPPISSLNFKCINQGANYLPKDEKCWLNRKVSRRMSDEEGKKEFPEEAD